MTWNIFVQKMNFVFFRFIQKLMELKLDFNIVISARRKKYYYSTTAAFWR